MDSSFSQQSQVIIYMHISYINIIKLFNVNGAQGVTANELAKLSRLIKHFSLISLCIFFIVIFNFHITQLGMCQIIHNI